jgi:hypothetical protein
MALGLPNRSFGSACHWQPVRSTYIMASKIFRDGIGFLPPPDLRLYVFSGSLSGEGISGSTFTQKVSETSQDLTRAIITSATNSLLGNDYSIIITKSNFYLRISS